MNEPELAVSRTLVFPLAAVDAAVMLRPMVVLRPLVRLTEAGFGQVIPAGAVQVKLSVPAKPFIEATLMMSVNPLPAATETRAVCGTMEKSESGLLMVLSVVADAA